jgi:hypothetical protein
MLLLQSVIWTYEARWLFSSRIWPLKKWDSFLEAAVKIDSSLKPTTVSKYNHISLSKLCDSLCTRRRLIPINFLEAKGMYFLFQLSEDVFGMQLEDYLPLFLVKQTFRETISHPSFVEDRENINQFLFNQIFFDFLRLVRQSYPFIRTWNMCYLSQGQDWKKVFQADIFKGWC